MTADNRDGAMAGMLRESLGNRQPDENCLDAGTIAAYYERSLDAPLISKCEAHLAECARCRQQIAMMVRAERPAPARIEAKARWIWDWRFLAPATAALVVLTIWGVRHSTPTVRDPKGSEPLVAMSKPQEPRPQVTPQALPEAAAKSKPTPPKKVDGLARIPAAPQIEVSDAHAFEKAKEPLRGTLLAPSAQSSDESLKQPTAISSPSAPAAAKSLASGASVDSPIIALQAPSAPSAARGKGMSDFTNGPIAQAKIAGNELPATKQAQSADRIREYAPANQTPASQAERQSEETIIATPDRKVLWRIAGSGFVERSEDMGATWNGQVPLPNARLTAGWAPTAKTCWLVGEDGTILLTEDGSHWSKIAPPVPANFVAVTAKSASSATITTSDGQKFSTSDGGKKWTPSQ